MSTRKNKARDARIGHARELRREMTEPEQMLWRALREAPPPGTHLRRQATLGPYFADFACHRTRLIVEIDGHTHGSEIETAHDAQRTAYLNQQGYRVLRFWNGDVVQNIAGVIAAIHAAAESARADAPPTPDPSPPRATLAGGGEKTVASGKDVRP